MAAPPRPTKQRSRGAFASVLLGIILALLAATVISMIVYPDEARELLQDSGLREAVEQIERKDAHGGRAQYLDAVAPRDEGVRELAIEITRKCKEQDRGCEASRLLTHVASKIKYVSDPRGEGDFVQPPMRTVELGAGDCEDQTILLASLFEAVGIRTLLAFTDNHVYAMACTEEPIAKRHLGKGAVSYAIDGGELHCYPAEPTNPKARLGQEHEHEGFLHVADPVDGSIHQFVREG